MAAHGTDADRVTAPGLLSPTKRRALQRMYGLSEDDFAALLAGCNHRCPMCERRFCPTRPPCVDHDHASGLITGLACSRCNDWLLGRFGRDPAYYRRVADYLEHPPAARLPGARRRAPGAAPSD
jgi:hypothetical protein